MKKAKNPFKQDNEIDLTSLIDVVFLIIIFFMVASTFEKEEEIFNITLPKADNAASQELKKDANMILLTKDGEYINGKNEEIIPKKELGKKLASLDHAMPVVIKADEAAPVSAYTYLIGVLNELEFFEQSLVIKRKE